MIARLSWGEFTHRRENTKRITSQHDDIGALTINGAGDLNMFDGIRAPVKG
jgi:hypothetical protein